MTEMTQLSNDAIEQLLVDQTTNWPLAKTNYHNLHKVKSKTVKVNGAKVLVQFNPARIISTESYLDERSILNRKCFLCEANRPSFQSGIPFVALSGNRYKVLVNPYPIFPKHFTIPEYLHTPQSIQDRYEDMVDLVNQIDDYVVFYNGPLCGASAPDHFHFQAGNKGFLPLEKDFASFDKKTFFSSYDVRLSYLTQYIPGTFVIESEYKEKSISIFYKLLATLPHEADKEPMINILLWKNGDTFITIIFQRIAHRPTCFYAQGSDRIIISPASVDLGGVFIAPVRKDYRCLNSKRLENIIAEVCPSHLDMKAFSDSVAELFRRYQPKVNVGLMASDKIVAFFLSEYHYDTIAISGEQLFVCEDGKIKWRGNLYDELFFEPNDYTQSCFELEGVTIGIDFHWERKENQKFQGGFVLIVEKGKLQVINLIGVEDYLISVISSEMNISASKEFLKAHAVISRSWLLAQIKKSKDLNNSSQKYSSCYEDENKRIKWYDKEDHISFDVCADDHCQRYQGMSRVTNSKITDVINETWGEVLKYQGSICDARFSKCCGGVTEEFPTCWEDVDHPYLVKRRDLISPKESDMVPDLTTETRAQRWIMYHPDSFCNTSDPAILSHVLNNYDNETKDFYRWQVAYSQEEIAKLLRERTGIDFGDILELLPLKRGTSGRIFELKVIGTNRAMVFGKELEIRRILSTTHLYSSAFIVKKEGVDKKSDEVEIPARFILFGAGWGHGVGLCQIGAAVMGEKGYSYDQILLHYFTDVHIESEY